MSDYTAPLNDIRLALKVAGGMDDLRETGAFGDLSAELVDAVLDEAGKFARDVIAPLNRVGDVQGARLADDRVKVPDGFAEAYRQYVEGGWMGVACDPEQGGQGLPLLLANAVDEMVISACMAFALAPTLTHGAVEALQAHASDEQKRVYLTRLVSGEWTGTMNLTEPQAGSDVGALTSKAVPRGDGSYAITGGKIFITYGEHEMSDNIVHLVLARLPDAPAGTRGISLFIVPKYLPDAEGKPGKRNDLRCVGLEEKLGIHGSPTCVMSFGEKEGAVGFLLGEENRGMACMFTMMNNVRLNVGLEGVAIGERAYQQALAYAQERRQGKPLGQQHADVPMVPIIVHPDVRRMLLTMRALVQAARGVCYANAAAIDLARKSPDDAARARAQARADLLTPIAKGWSTDIGVEVASLGIQVHGGMGYIEETGAAQHFRDARIAPIYEGTNGIQAMDLVSRKVPMQGGAVIGDFIAEIRETAAACENANRAELQTIGAELARAADAWEAATRWLLERAGDAPNDCLAGATPYLKLSGIVSGGFFMARSALAGAPGATPQDEAAVATASFYARNILPGALGLVTPVMAGADALYALDESQLAP